MSIDAPSKCVICHEVIQSCVDEAWLWECRQSQIGPMHHGCAAELIAADPTTFSLTEPEQVEPEHQDDYDHRMAMWPGGLDASGKPRPCAENDAAVAERFNARQAVVTERQRVLSIGVGR